MDAAKIQAKVYYGYGKSAAHVGVPFDQYRSTGSYPPLDLQNLVGQINASMTIASSSSFNFGRAPLENNNVFSCLADGRALQIGDYLQRVSDGVNFFVGSMETILPIVAVRCNGLVSAKRRAPTKLKPGLNTYQGPVEASEQELLSGIPACIQLQSAGRNTHGSNLPSDAPGPLKFEILLSPLMAEFCPAVNDIVTDDQGRRFLVSGTQKTPIAIRLDVVHEMA